MLKREYRGPPIDAREQYITERPVMSGTTSKDEVENGETVAGTSADDFFSESTENMPSHIDTEEVSDDELQAIGWALSVSISHAAKVMDRFTETDIKHIVDEHLNDDDIARIRDYDRVPSIPLEELSDKQREAAEAYLSHPKFPDVSPRELAQENDFRFKTAERAIHTIFPGHRDYDDLRGEIQMGILIWAHEGTDNTLAAIQEKYPVPNGRAIGDARRIYPDLIEEKQPFSASELEQALKEYRENNSRSTSDSGKGSNGQSKSTRSQKPKEDKTYPDDFSECYQWFIETIAENPGVSRSELIEQIPEDKGWSPQNYYNVCNSYANIVKRRIEELGSVESPEEINDYLLDKTADLGEWDIREGSDDELNVKSEVEAEIEDQTSLDLDADLQVTPSVNVLGRHEKVIFLHEDLAEKAHEFIKKNGEYSSLNQLAKTAIRKELKSEYTEGEEIIDEPVGSDIIEAVIELADVEPAKADAIRTLISNE